MPMWISRVSASSREHIHELQDQGHALSAVLDTQSAATSFLIVLWLFTTVTVALNLGKLS
ncbi:hypothetical protein [Sandarakinorhabdus cyanobacteriorum]|uniref:hypothetical protein n=1 Tax=Sandarakinorhabdus cyanobacteriorum TaxID=1981098 RepID=UPI001056B369|nr:hypothetical protein [Sandarakinorhabdus cyanobacteriorum]